MNIFTSATAAAFIAPHTKIHYGQDMPPGSIHCAIDCTADPLNVLYPVDQIMKTIAARRAAIGPDKTLVVLMGERHDTATHHAMQVLLLQKLQAAGEEFTVNFEKPHNEWSKIARQGMNLDVARDLVYTPGQYDPDGKAALSAVLVCGQPACSPLSTMNTQAFCYSSGITSCFNDVAMTGNYKLHLSDPITQQAAQEYFTTAGTDMPQDIDVREPAGVAIRNAVMAELALKHAQRQGRNLIIQLIGSAHLMGYTKLKFPFKDSLCQKFMQQGAEVLMAVPTSNADSLKHIPPEADAAIRENTIAVYGLAEDYFRDDNGTHRSFSAEWDFLTRINNASGGQMPLVNVPNNLASASFYSTRSHALNVIERYNAAQQTPAPKPTAPAL